MKRVGSATDKDVLERRQRVIRGDFFNSAEDIRRTDNSLNLRWAAPLWKLKVIPINNEFVLPYINEFFYRYSYRPPSLTRILSEKYSSKIFCLYYSNSRDSLKSK